MTVDIASEIAARLGLPVSFVCFDAARKSFEALTSGVADLCFMAIEPARAADVDFTAPYVLIEGVFVVPDDSAIRSVADVDRPGVRIGVKEGSAYDLYLTRSFEHATLVRGAEGADVFVDAGPRGRRRHPPAADRVRLSTARPAPGRRGLHADPAGRRHAKGHAPATVQFLHDTVEELKADRLRRGLAGEVRPCGHDGRPAA